MLPPLILLLLQLMFLPPAPDSVAVLSPALEHTVPAQCSFSNEPKLTPTGHGGRVGEGGQAGSRGCHYIGLRNTEKTAAARYSRHFYPFCSVSPCSVLPYFFLPCSILPCWVLPCSVHPCSVFQCCVLPCCVLPCSVLLCSVHTCSVLQCSQWEIIVCEVWQARPQKGSFVSFLVKCVSNVRSKLEKCEFFRKAVFKKFNQLHKVLVIFFFLQSVHTRSWIIYGGCFKGPKIWICARTTQETLSITLKLKMSKYKSS